MNYSKRIKQLCHELEECESFADVGCDHGYCTKYMIDNCLCKRAVISDISAECLKKAETLLKADMIEGVVISVCCNGLEKISPDTSLVLIAGMGGKEIIQILQNSFIPKKFVFQPMKNSEELRRFLVESGCKITADYTFRDGKFYDVIKGENEGGNEAYTDDEYEFGRDNLREKRKDFIAQIEIMIDRVHTYMVGKMTDESRKNLFARLNKLKAILYEMLD